MVGFNQKIAQYIYKLGVTSNTSPGSPLRSGAEGQFRSKGRGKGMVLMKGGKGRRGVLPGAPALRQLFRG